MAFLTTLFGAKPTAAQQLAAAGIQVQSSAYGRPYSLVFGKTRIAGTLIWYGDFGTNTVSVNGGKGILGGKGGSGTTYYASIILAICDGPVSDIPNVWLNNPTNEALNLAGLGYIGGDLNQEPWTWLTSKHPDQAIGYSGIALVVGNNINLGSNSSLPNYNFEVCGLEYATSGNGDGDADPDLVVNDLLTSPQYGIGFPANLVGSIVNNREAHTVPSPGPYTVTVNNASAYLFNLSVVRADGTIFVCVAGAPAAKQYSFNSSTGVYTFNVADAGASISICYASGAGLDNYHNFCRASGLWISPAYDSQQAANTILADIATYTYSEFVWSSGVLTLVPLGATNLSANGATYTAPSAPLFALDDDDFLENQSTLAVTSATANTDPVIESRTRASDQYNDIQVEWLDRENQYAVTIAEATDAALIDRFTRRTAPVAQAHLFCEAGAANTCANLLLQAQYIRRRFSITLDERYCVLDPGDLVTLTDSTMGLSERAALITEIQENDDGTLSMALQEWPAGLGAAEFTVNTGQGYNPDYNADPGPVNAPVLFEVPVEIATNTGLELWCAVSGSDMSLWGGCDIYASSDGTTYKLVGRQQGAARMGVTTADFPVGPDPDTADMLAVNLAESEGALLSGTQSDADLGNTLCLVGSELVAYETATLTTQYNYDLGTYIRRGMYGTTVADHPTGSQFARLDNSIFAVPYTKDQIGQTIYLKFTSINIWGAGEEALSDVAAYTHTIAGPPIPPDVTGFAVKQIGGAVAFTWNAVVDAALKGYDIRYEPQGTTLSTSSPILTEIGAGTEMTNASIQSGTWTFGIWAHDMADQLSADPATADLTVTNPNPIVVDDLEGPGWTGTLSGFLEHWTGVLTVDSLYPPSHYTMAELFTSYVPNPVASSVYSGQVLDAGFSSSLRVYATTTANLGPGQATGPVIQFAIDAWASGSDPDTWTNWTIGNVTFRYLRGRITLANIADQVSYVQQFEVIADQTAAVVDSSSNAAIAAGGTAVAFNQQFHSPPSVVCQVVGSTALYATAANVTTTGCTIHVWNSAGSDVGGTVNWVATGD